MPANRVTVKDPGRRGVGSQLSLQESRHRLARKIFYGHRGEPLRQAYREGQEDQLGALGLVFNAVVLWNTRYLDAVPSKLRASGYPVLDENVARLSPLGDPLSVNGHSAAWAIGDPSCRWSCGHRTRLR